MFIDDVKIFVKGGKGGNGAVAFRRENTSLSEVRPEGRRKGWQRDFVGDEGLTTLLDFRYQKHIVAPDGENGKPKNCYGRDGKDIRVKVPVGSVVTDLTTGAVLADITRHGQEAVIARGGRGGRGNTRFATPKIPAPEFAEKGEAGEEREIRIELKILADVGLVGFPNVGKSTLISALSSAKPKIADYPFTTLVPNLGVVQAKDGRSFVAADLPGLIEGASEGAGLGFRFLKHIERTRVIVHVLDMAIKDRDPHADYLTINQELENYNPKLLLRPQIIAANKMDLPEAEENLKILKEKIRDVPIIPVSAYARRNLDELVYKIADVLDSVAVDAFLEPVREEIVEYKLRLRPRPSRSRRRRTEFMLSTVRQSEGISKGRISTAKKRLNASRSASGGSASMRNCGNSASSTGTPCG